MPPSTRVVASTMRADWDERARKNARYYVATGQEEWSDKEFFDSGRDWIQSEIHPFLEVISGGAPPRRLRVLEIGCGVGRMTLGLSELFGSVDAVDISREMITRAEKSLGRRENIRFHVNNGFDLSMFRNKTFDFVFSAIALE